MPRQRDDVRQSRSRPPQAVWVGNADLKGAYGCGYDLAVDLHDWIRVSPPLSTYRANHSRAWSLHGASGVVSASSNARPQRRTSCEQSSTRAVRTMAELSWVIGPCWLRCAGPGSSLRRRGHAAIREATPTGGCASNALPDQGSACATNGLERRAQGGPSLTESKPAITQRTDDQVSRIRECGRDVAGLTAGVH